MMTPALVLLALLVPVQDPPPVSFATEDRWVAAYYTAGIASDARKELEDMASVGVDIAVLMAGRGYDPTRVADALAAALEKNPRIKVRLAPFVDPAAPDQISTFFAAVPSRFRARIDGRPVVWFAPAAENAPAPKLPEEPAVFVVADVAWKAAKADLRYAWMSSQEAPARTAIASVGRGAKGDDEGNRYRRSWYVAGQSEAKRAVLEFWNENGAVPGVNEEENNERKFLEFTRNFARRFRKEDPIDPPGGPYAESSSLVYTLKYNPTEQGLRLLDASGGRVRIVRMAGLRALTTRAKEGSNVRTVAFDVDDSFSFMRRRSVQVSVEFWDVGKGAFSIEYDSADRSLAPAARIVKRTEERRFENLGGWRRVSFDLPDAWFGNGQEGGADFRIRIEKRGIMLRLVMVKPK